MGCAGRQLLWHLKKISDCSERVHSYSRHINSMRNATPANISIKLPHGHMNHVFRGTFLQQVSAFSNIRRFIAERIVNIKRSSVFRRYSGGSSFSSSEGVIYSIVAGNVVVFLLWNSADRRFMYKNFQISVDNFLNGRVHTLITHAFSHKDFYHLFSNMFGFYFFGSTIARTFGSKYLLKLYLAGALGGSIFFLINEAIIVPWRKGISRNNFNPRYTPPAMGASGALNAIMFLSIFLYPKEVIYVNLVIPVPAMLFGACLIGYDLWRVKQGDTQISGAAHLGGALVGILAWAKIKRPWI
ncbi:RHOMBOID-like protein 12, mitochondrial isoform X1 [Cryptomeria japonica]|uniref:RHOMBOID-like protein 12, mitochondrial isoform X1 n=1 Tax=Cryptomeria japonica TaxID=3369 RepID=UPI0025AC2FA4|nr:RHOMBOID-like protein 12, mitochondrial isoform X1 [Cryptomeria japonica]XP_057868786.1 RHOMBOID-like protein 12, mitochondrial isoform X1 [Cryptomeria japonica]